MNDSIKTQLDLFGHLVISPKGTSMLPFLKENKNSVDIGLPKEPIKKYDIVLYKKDDLYILHRVIKCEEGFFIICGDNSNVLEKIPKQDIIGVVTEIISANKKTMANNRFLRFRVMVWYTCGLKKAVMLFKRGLKHFGFGKR